MKLSSLRESSRFLLEKKIGRRAFVARLGKLGIASTAATAMAARLEGISTPEALSGRQLPAGLTGGEIMAEMLLEWKVPYVFGLGGSEEVGFLDALVDRIPLQYVLALHEGSVLSLADGYARASGETAFLNLHSIVGTGYALGPMVNAFKDRTSLVITAGRQSTDIRGSEAFLEAVNLHMLPREFTRWTWDVLSVDSIPETLRRAFLLARVPPGGPTFVTFSKDLWEKKTRETQLPSRARSPVEERLLPDRETISRAVDRLVEARFPLLVAGRELNRYGGIDQLVRIAEILGAPVMGDVPASHTPAGFPTNHPQYAGLFTLEPDFPPPSTSSGRWEAPCSPFSRNPLNRSFRPRQKFCMLPSKQPRSAETTPSTWP